MLYFETLKHTKAMQEESPKKGRPKKSPDKKRRNRTLRMTDAEYEELVTKPAQAANLEKSEYIIKKLKL